VAAQSDGPVMAIVVGKGGEFRELVVAVALASARYDRRHAERIDPLWRFERMAKSVRRAKKRPHLDRLVAEEGGLEVVVGDARAIALHPVLYEDFPRLVADAQVSTIGREAPEAPWSDGSAGRLHVALDGDLGMSPGKSAAQAAHALMQLAQQHPEVELTAEEVALEVVPGDRFRELAKRPDAVVVQDAGFTEVDPDSRTAVGWFA
jgi:hypothetical protein